MIFVIKIPINMRLIIVFTSLFLLGCLDKLPHETPKNLEIPFEVSGGEETSTYEEVISFYKRLSHTYPSISVFEVGKTDSGHPLHVVTFSKEKVSSLEDVTSHQKNVLLINNGIHPGESDGIDASMMLLRDVAEGTIPPPQNTIIAVIPIYNVGGALNRNSHSRTNQNGPKAYGFRGNARNFDLNRDFIKADTKNAQCFAKIFHLLKPDWFIDNHVSNGADYQYVLTHLFTQHNKLGGALGEYLNDSFMPELQDSLALKNWDITPYVNVFNKTPETGFSQFMDYPRYSTGYTTLFNTVGMMVETHMLKPYKQRVMGTYELMKSFINIAEKDAEKMAVLRKEYWKNYTPGSSYPISWEIDSAQVSTLQFKGYEAASEKSKITNLPRLKYHRQKPFTRPITYYNYFKPSKGIVIPSKYIVPKGYWNIIEQLKNNDIKFRILEKDTIITAEVYHIQHYETFQNPYEGHYPHYNTEVNAKFEKVPLKAGDYIVETQQPGVRYLLETLEPSAVDSFFNWNYFDAILQQKEGFSPYVWEDLAFQFLKENPAIAKEFDNKKREDQSFAANWYAQLDWLHKQSPYYEKAHLRYPILRVLD